MMLKAIVTEDTFTEYLSYLQTRVEEEKPEMLRKMARRLVGNYDEPDDGFIAPLMSTDFNPNLFLSGQDEEYWEIGEKGDVSVLYVTYTGKRLHDLYAPGQAKVWSEFSVDGAKYELERDYAYYQETGHDSIAKSSDAKHKYAIKFGVLAGAYAVRESAGLYLNQIMQGQTK